MAQVLIIQLARVGDVIQSTPLLQALLEQGNEVDVLLQRGNEVLLEGLPVRTIYPIEPAVAQDLNQRLAAADGADPGTSLRPPDGGLGLPRYDWVINLSNHRCGAWLSQQIEADRRSGGVFADGEWLFEGDWPTYLFSLMESRIQNRFNLVDVWRGLAPGLIPASGTRAWVAREEIPSDWLPEGRMVALNPGAHDPERCWPAASFARVAEGLCKIGIMPILVGGPDDRAICAAVRAEAEVEIPDFSGRTSLGQMATLLSKMELVVSNDTAAAHIAAAVGTPVVSLHAASSFYRETAPWGEGHIALQAGRPDAPEPMKHLSVRIVQAVIMNRLGRATRLHLQNELAGAQALAWETAWIPAGLDPLGGVTYRPLHQVKCDVRELFDDALRHVLAWDLCGRPGARPAEAVVAFLAAQTGSLAPDLLTEASALASVVVQFVGRMEAIAQTLDEMRGTDDPAQHQTLLNRTIDSIRSVYDDGVRQQYGIDLVVRNVNWKLKLQAHASAEATLGAYRAEYQRAAEVLSQTLAIWSQVLDAVAAPVA